jgi:hypothetical protein
MMANLARSIAVRRAAAHLLVAVVAAASDAFAQLEEPVISSAARYGRAPTRRRRPSR